MVEACTSLPTSARRCSIAMQENQNASSLLVHVLQDAPWSSAWYNRQYALSDSDRDVNAFIGYGFKQGEHRQRRSWGFSLMRRVESYAGGLLCRGRGGQRRRQRTTPRPPMASPMSSQSCRGRKRVDGTSAYDAKERGRNGDSEQGYLTISAVMPRANVMEHTFLKIRFWKPPFLKSGFWKPAFLKSGFWKRPVFEFSVLETAFFEFSFLETACF